MASITRRLASRGEWWVCPRYRQDLVGLTITYGFGQKNTGIGTTREKLKALTQGRSKVAARTAEEFHHQTQTRQEGGLHPPYLLLAA
jgi:hypothetical protein